MQYLYFMFDEKKVVVFFRKEVKIVALKENNEKLKDKITRIKEEQMR